MNHVILILPVLGLSVFLFLPARISVPVYLFILLLSGLIYWVVYRAMKKRPQLGMESMKGMEARVVAKPGLETETQYLVRIRGETWGAVSGDNLAIGDKVKIIAVDGLILQVQKISLVPPTEIPKTG